MNIINDEPLSKHSTMKLGGTAKYAVPIYNQNELVEALNWTEEKNLPTIMVGGGSNIVWRDEGFDGLLLINKIRRYEAFKEDPENLYVNIGAGEVWDDVVAQTVEAGATGIEALSLIPGSAGATPIQNVNAYGQEIAQTLVTVEAYDTKVKQFVNVTNTDCHFSYRKSRFNSEDRGRFYVTGITLHLRIGNPLPPYYTEVQQHIDENNITNLTPALLREIVINLRRNKLPDPSLIANNGSFFVNPILNQAQFTQLLADHPGIRFWRQDDNRIKVSAAWLIEKAGFKGFKDSETGMAVWHNQPLVLVNESAKSTADLIKFRDKIISLVEREFNVRLVQEPELLP